MDSFEFILVIITIVLASIIALFVGAVTVSIQNRKETEKRLARCDDVCSECVFFCPDCGCTTEECHPFNFEALYFDGEAEMMHRDTHIKIEDADIVVKGKPKKYSE